MEDAFASRKAIPKPQSFIPIPNSRQKSATATRAESTRFGFEGIETTNVTKSAATSFETTEASTKYTSTTKKDELTFQKNWKSSSLGQLSNYKVVNVLPQEKENETSTQTDGNADDSKGNTDGFKEEKAFKECLEAIKAQKAEFEELFSVKQRELEETVREERSMQERYFTLEIVKLQRKFREEVANLTQKFDEDKMLLEQYNKEQLKEIMEQQCFEKDEKTTCQIDEFKRKQELKIQKMFSFAVAAIFISVLSILISLLW